jgi:hypothetical protein
MKTTHTRPLLLFLPLILFILSGFITVPSSTIPSFQEGDVVFQSSHSSQAKAIQLATNSPYSHCGIIFKEKNGAFVVYEAVQPVKKTPLQQWIDQGHGQYYVVRRLKNAPTVLTPEIIGKMKKDFLQYEGKNYDLYFGWSDDRIYCSELVWKLYKNTTQLEVGEKQLLKEFDLSHPLVKMKLKERYKDAIPYEEPVISPAAIYQSPLFETVADTYPQ